MPMHVNSRGFTTKVKGMYQYLMNPTASSDGTVDLSHVTIVSYSNIHPTWDTIAEVDRAFFRGMGYTVVVP